MAKMGALGSPLDALTLNYLSYGFLAALNSLWTWIAVVTAAVSFWRIRALSAPLEKRARTRDASSTSSAPPKEAEMTATEQTRIDRPSRAAVAGGVQVEREALAKTKFSLHYEAEEFMEDDDGGESDEDTGIEFAVTEKFGWFYDDSERMMVVRMGDLGWYRWQDATVLDGSVVRLWRRHAAADGGGSV